MFISSATKYCYYLPGVPVATVVFIASQLIAIRDGASQLYFTLLFCTDWPMIWPLLSLLCLPIAQATADDADATLRHHFGAIHDIATERLRRLPICRLAARHRLLRWAMISLLRLVLHAAHRVDGAGFYRLRHRAQPR